MNKFLKGVLIGGLVVFGFSHVGQSILIEQINKMQAEMEAKDLTINDLRIEVDERDAEIIRLNALPK